MPGHFSRKDSDNQEIHNHLDRHVSRKLQGRIFKEEDLGFISFHGQNKSITMHGTIPSKKRPEIWMKKAFATRDKRAAWSWVEEAETLSSYRRGPTSDVEIHTQKGPERYKTFFLKSKGFGLHTRHSSLRSWLEEPPKSCLWEPMGIMSRKTIELQEHLQSRPTSLMLALAGTILAQPVRAVRSAPERAPPTAALQSQPLHQVGTHSPPRGCPLKT